MGSRQAVHAWTACFVLQLVWVVALLIWVKRSNAQAR
jgi:hypothetical protein